MSSDGVPIRTVITTDGVLIEQGLSALLAQSARIEVVGRVRDADDLRAVVEELLPDAVIISIRTSVVSDPVAMATMETAYRLHQDFLSLSVIVISDRGNGFALELLKGGSSRIAYLIDDRSLSLEALLGTLSELRAGGTVLDPSIVDGLVGDRLEPEDGAEAPRAEAPRVEAPRSRPHWTERA